MFTDVKRKQKIMKNKRKIFSMLLCIIMILIVTCTGCSASKTDEERWNAAGVIEADDVDKEADYSKFEEKEPEDSLVEDNSTEETSGSENNKDTSKKQGSVSQNHSSKDNPENEEKSKTCTISISCKTILSNMDNLKEGKESLVPSNGVILGSTSVEISDGDSVFDILKKVTRNNGIHMEYVNTPGYDSAYIEGIGNLYEKDCGGASGWMYSVNGSRPDYGCSQYKVNDGDVIRFDYTCDLGKDL